MDRETGRQIGRNTMFLSCLTQLPWGGIDVGLEAYRTSIGSEVTGVKPSALNRMV
jgi:hypothetical protein